MGALIGLSFFVALIGAFMSFCYYIFQLALFMIIIITPTAPDSFEVDMSNYDSWQVIAKEYNNTTRGIKSKHFLDRKRATSRHKMQGTYALRSTPEGQVYLIAAEDDKRFNVYNSGVYRIEMNPTKFKWAVRGCRNNMIGCKVKVDVVYDFNQPDFPVASTYNYRLELERTK